MFESISKLVFILSILLLISLTMTSIQADNLTDINETQFSNSNSTFSDLNKKISESSDYIILNESFRFDSTHDYALNNGVKISKNIVIRGNGNICIDGAKSARGLFIESHSNVVLENIVFKNGYCENSGGAIYLSPYSNLIIRNCTFIGNKVYNSDGGAIDDEEGTNIEIYNSLFTQNVAKRVSDLDLSDFKKGMGSAICTRIGSSLKLYDTVFKNNKGYMTTILVITYDDVKRKQSLLFVKNCTFENNTSTSSGAIYLDEFGKCEILDSVFRNNYVKKRSGTLVLDASVKAVVKNCLFDSNTANKGGAIFIKIFENKYEADVTISDCNFTNNHAYMYGGAIYAKIWNNKNL